MLLTEFFLKEKEISGNLGDQNWPVISEIRVSPHKRTLERIAVRQSSFAEIAAMPKGGRSISLKSPVLFPPWA